MQKNIIKKGLVIAIIFLFIAVSFQPIIAKDTILPEKKSDTKDLLETIIDIANNKEIQRIILKSQLNRGILFNSDIKFPIFNTPLVTENKLKQMYVIGLTLSNIISKSKIYSIVEKYQYINPNIQQEISAVIKKNPILNAEITQLENSDCDCENKNLSYWNFPVTCSVLLLLILSMEFILLIVYRITGIYFVKIYNKLVGIIGVFATLLKCPWI